MEGQIYYNLRASTMFFHAFLLRHQEGINAVMCGSSASEQVNSTVFVEGLGMVESLFGAV